MAALENHLCWPVAGEFLARQAGELGLDATAGGGWAGALRPRKGLLLEMARPEGMPEVHRGMMELGYTKVCVGRDYPLS